ncbi:conserved hypothetical protein [Lasallia pustulata]|uniref:Uncharacterized protein n=1 Tax=Lasallia pustulata TaxID=136370 RepID=A0A1W5CVU7_9LECA|nr:conserved hypothetical protein [Lasallia pustulata]
MAAILPEKNLYLRDISQAYIQSTTFLNRDFFVRPPAKLKLQEGSILKVIKPLYGVPEAGNHWFNTYHCHHTEKLQMEQSIYDPCLLYCTTSFGIVGLQTDDTLFLADKDFATAENHELHKAKLLAKERELLTESSPLKFNGGHIEKHGVVITLTQPRQCKNLSLIRDWNVNLKSSQGEVRNSVSPKDQYVAQRARGAYIATVCQPEAAFDLSFAAQTTKPEELHVKNLNKRLR